MNKNQTLLDEFQQIEGTLFWRTFSAQIKERFDFLRNCLETEDDNRLFTKTQGEISGLRWVSKLAENLVAKAKQGNL